MQMMGMFVRGRSEDGLWVLFACDRRRSWGRTIVILCRSERGLEYKGCADRREQRSGPRRIIGRRVLWDDHKGWVRHLGGRRCLYSRDRRAHGSSSTSQTTVGEGRQQRRLIRGRCRLG